MKKHAFEVATLALGTSAIIVFSPACKPLVKVDVECDKLCMSSAGPTLPALLAPANHGVDAGSVDAWDSVDGQVVATPGTSEWGGIDSGLAVALPLGAGATILATPAGTTVEWTAILEFNRVLKELPNGSTQDQAKVLLTRLFLSSSQDLNFVDSVDVSISHSGKLDAALRRQSSGVGNEAIDAQSAALPCAVPGGRLSVARFERAQANDPGNQLPLLLLSPDLNLFDCVKDDPTAFNVTMAFLSGHYPMNDTPLTLSTCVSSEMHVAFP